MVEYSMLITAFCIFAIVIKRYVALCEFGLHSWGPNVKHVVIHSGTKKHPFTHRCGSERRYCMKCGKNGNLRPCLHGQSNMPRSEFPSPLA